jgi:hypothetical protein
MVSLVNAVLLFRSMRRPRRLGPQVGVVIAVITIGRYLNVRLRTESTKGDQHPRHSGLGGHADTFEVSERIVRMSPLLCSVILGGDG